MPGDLTLHVLTFGVDEQTFIQYVKEQRGHKGEGEVGMDQCETRSWVSRHHQMAHLFLVRLCRVFKKVRR